MKIPHFLIHFWYTFWEIPVYHFTHTPLFLNGKFHSYPPFAAQLWCKVPLILRKNDVKTPHFLMHFWYTFWEIPVYHFTHTPQKVLRLKQHFIEITYGIHQKMIQKMLIFAQILSMSWSDFETFPCIFSLIPLKKWRSRPVEIDFRVLKAASFSCMHVKVPFTLVRTPIDLGQT